MSQDYVLNQKCPACGTRHASTLQAIKSQRVFECQCCGLVLALRAPVDPAPKQTTEKVEEEALAV